MKKIFLTTISIFFLSLFGSFACGGAGYAEVASYSSNSCNTSFNFLGIVRKWNGSITQTTTFKQVLTGEICEVVSSTGCGANGGSWDWFWEKR